MTGETKTRAKRADPTVRAALIGAPLEDGASRRGCLMGPDALRVAGVADALAALGVSVEDRGTVAPLNDAALGALEAPPGARAFRRIAAWTRALAAATRDAARDGAVPITLGGDHSVAAGSVAGVAQAAAEAERALHVVWLDAHADFNTPETSPSGNMHGMAASAFCGLDPLRTLYDPAHDAWVDPARVHMIGLRSVDPEERGLLRRHGVNVHDMRAIDEHGVAALTRSALAAAEADDALIHVSLDIDMIDPEIAPGVGTTVPGGCTYREAHLVMEMLHESGRVAALDLVELNPFLDDRGRSALLLVELTESLFGRTVMDRPTPPFSRARA